MKHPQEGSPLPVSGEPDPAWEGGVTMQGKDRNGGEGGIPYRQEHLGREAGGTSEPLQLLTLQIDLMSEAFNTRSVAFSGANCSSFQLVYLTLNPGQMLVTQSPKYTLRGHLSVHKEMTDATLKSAP